MDKEKKDAASTARVKWKSPRPFFAIPGIKLPIHILQAFQIHFQSNLSITDEDKEDMFGLKPIQRKSAQNNVSLLTQQLQKRNFQSHNPFREYAKFDGNVRIFTCSLT